MRISLMTCLTFLLPIIFASPVPLEPALLSTQPSALDKKYLIFDPFLPSFIRSSPADRELLHKLLEQLHVSWRDILLAMATPEHRPAGSWKRDCQWLVEISQHMAEVYDLSVHPLALFPHSDLDFCDGFNNDRGS